MNAEAVALAVGVDRLIFSSRKTLSLEIRPDASVWVRAPQKIPDRILREFVESRRDWILRKQDQVRERGQANGAGPVFAEGGLFWFLGRRYPLRVAEKNLSGIVWNEEAFFMAPGFLAQAGRLFEIWYRNRARRILRERVHAFASPAQLPYRSIKITGAKTRWGSCGPDGTLNFSWRLVMAPRETVDYVVAHELAHLTVRDHSPRFWRRVSELFPQYRPSRLWLRQNQSALTWPNDSDNSP